MLEHSNLKRNFTLITLLKEESRETSLVTDSAVYQLPFVVIYFSYTMGELCLSLLLMFSNIASIVLAGKFWRAFYDSSTIIILYRFAW